MSFSHRIAAAALKENSEQFVPKLPVHCSLHPLWRFHRRSRFPLIFQARHRRRHRPILPLSFATARCLEICQAVLWQYNVERQLPDSTAEIAYVMVDIADVTPEGIKTIYNEISVLPANIGTHNLY